MAQDDEHRPEIVYVLAEVVDIYSSGGSRPSDDLVDLILQSVQVGVRGELGEWHCTEIGSCLGRDPSG
ncbi:MAG: hypothetical protein U0R50_14345 [Gaiellales bacterium]